ncbi:hypothetical protein LEP1GSC058_3513 [Leptospira fainei serovar Hurstbridge str. BUT 6]|uniref:Uncharacterized protein n=1 Tax=Leptospira fainei serovar Hurstbridge str. BUT 6 TaxID=1193011 RepID=S3W018_9LEPT|nr:hypothetical protein [Leptospira fainei]EPG73687.1 hypothetical protein LEP1GSC058_3513 [Leptospira fainei serovar Hurstbridge str. BUT 6]
MIQRQKAKIKLAIFVLAALLIWSGNSLYAGEAFELDGDPTENDLRIIAALNKLTYDRIISNKSTKGFAYRYTSRWYSPITIDVFVLGFSKREKLSLIRIESPKKGSERAFKNYLLEELTRKQVMDGQISQGHESATETSGRKSYLISGTLALLEPATSVYYNSSKSPVYSSSDTLKGMFGYIAADLLLAGLGYYYASTTIHSHSAIQSLMGKPTPSGNVLESPGAGVFLGLLLVPRLYRMVGSWQDTYSHNRILELNISKSF